MILKLWQGVSLENYNNWFPLTGKIENIPLKYKSDNPAQNWYKDVTEWFTTFALRAQNDINAYFGFIFNKFPFESLKNNDIKETLIDMVFMKIEFDCFNRIPAEFNVSATNTLTNGSSFDASADQIFSARNFLPERSKSLAKFTKLKPYFRVLLSQGINPNDIDLGTFYTKFQTDVLLETEKEARIQGNKDNKTLILDKQLKLYDDVIPSNSNLTENQVFRGPVSKIVNKSYVATSYDPATETMILDWPSEIGTLPPEALQPNPQEGDFTHAATADFSAKQQKRINNNENNISSNTNNIKDIKDNYFTLENNPLWKKINNNNIEIKKWYFIIWELGYIDKETKERLFSFNKPIKVYINENNKNDYYTVDSFIVDKMLNDKLYIFRFGISYNYNYKDFIFSSEYSNPEVWNYTPESTYLSIYQYQGTGTPI